MELRQLRYFVAVAEELHFGRAAKRLFISQPALSFDIRKFEDALGVQLFSRTNKTVALTNAGEVLLGEARRLLLQAAEAERLTVRSASGSRGPAADRLRSFDAVSRAARCGATLRGRLSRCRSRAERNEYAGAGAGDPARPDRSRLRALGPLPPEVESTPVYAEPFVCCLPAAHPLAKRKQVALAALAAEPFILFPREAAPHYHDLIIAQCVNAGFSPLIRHEARLWQTILSMIEFGMGIALVPRVLQQVKSERLAFRPLKDASLESRTLALKRCGTTEPVALRFADYVRASIDALPALAG